MDLKTDLKVYQYDNRTKTLIAQKSQYFIEYRYFIY